MSTGAIIGYCLTAFGLGYGCGWSLRIFRQAMDTLD